MNPLVRRLRAEDNTNYVIEDETDDKLRTATVYKVVTPFMNVNLPLDALQHWSLLFLFNDSTYIVVDANESGGKLTPRFAHLHRAEGEEMSSLSRTRRIDHLEISKLQLRKFVIANKLNYTNYDPIWNNCQDFLKSLKLWCQCNPVRRPSPSTVERLHTPCTSRCNPPKELSASLTAADIVAVGIASTIVVGGILLVRSLFSKDETEEK